MVVLYQGGVGKEGEVGGKERGREETQAHMLSQRK